MNAMLQSPATDAWLTAEEIDLVRAQFARIGEDADGFARDFYDALFSTAPLVRAMFRGDMAEQRVKLVRMLALLVAQLRSPESLSAPLAALGERHRGYGVIPADYESVGSALLKTLDSRLGADFGAEARVAWAKVYGHVASTMQAPGAISNASASP